MQEVLRIACAVFIVLTGFVIVPSQAQYLRNASWVAMGSNSIQTNWVNGISLQQSIGQISVTGSFTTASVHVNQGFLRGIRVISTEVRRPFEAIAFPNSFSDHLTLRFTTEHQEVTQVQIHDAQGKLVYVAMHQPKNKEIQLHLPHLSTGIYVASLSSGKKFVQLRLIKKP